MDSPSALPDLPPHQTLWKIAGAFAALAVLIYGLSVIRDSLILWDDNYLIYYNPHIKSLSFSNIAYNFTHFDPELYIPLTFLSYQIEHFVAGMSPVMFHFTNLALHWLNACGVALLLFFLTRNGRVAVLCGALFLAHPLNTEAVAWASARKDVLSTFFFLASTLLYLRYRSSSMGKIYLLSIAAFGLGLLSKVMIVTLPVILLLLDFAQGRKFGRGMLLDKIPYLALSILFGIVALFGKADTANLSTWSEKLLMAAKSTVFYLEKFFAPVHLSLLYPYTKPIAFSSPDFFVPVIIVALLAAVAIASLKKTRWIFAGFAFFLITLAPTFINFAKGGDYYFASDRYAYVPMIGLLLIVAWAVSYLSQSRKAMTRSTLALGCITAMFAILSYGQVEYWKDSETLLTHAVALYPDAFAGHLNLSVLYRTTNRDAEALDALEQAAKIKNHTRIESGRAAIYAKQGKIAEAYAAYKKAAELDPKDTEPHFGIAALYAREGKRAEAIREYEEALKRDPGYTNAHLNMAAIYLETKDYDNAAEQYRSALAIDPTYADAHFNLGVIAEEKGDSEAAVRSFTEVARIDPNALDAYVHLAELYLKLNNPDEAVRAVREANRINPNNEDAKFLWETFVKHGLMR
jgi:protein O-mannosyl-transferase